MTFLLLPTLLPSSLLSITSLHLRLNNVFVIGKGNKAYVSLPRGKGIKLSIAEERDRRLAQKVN
ncbi:40S ribosomal protein S4 [Portunus trituberculatus]|uniref:40S ribosomal protein S4 n=1 Tax=Portunus trituberculatus TaxID=210409 RepID=A0A5B7H2E1_PORTR|nr:40S ribosomal protein S4 [Portunus trituberculatus]